MCGRFSLTTQKQQLEDAFGVTLGEGLWPPRFNIAPSQPVLAVRLPEASRTENSHLPPYDTVLVRWGFIPAWVKAPEQWPLTFNIRSETAAEKRSFRNALHYHRVIIPASGFYEWQKRKNGAAQPYFIRPKHGGLIGFAGLMETWSSADGSQMDTAGTLTTNANAALKPLHPRQPVVLAREDFASWLDVRNNRPKDVQDLLRPVADDFFEIIPISDKINNTGYLGADVQKPLAAPPQAAPDKGGSQLDLF